MLSLPEDDVKHIWQKANHCLPDLANSRIFVTGGTGFFGRWLLASVAYAVQHLALKTEVVVLTRDPQKFLQQSPELKNASWLHWQQGDVRDFEFPVGDFTHVLHAATEASASLNRDNPVLMLDTITQGTRRVLEFAKQANVKQFLFISSGAVYGKQPADCTHIEESFEGGADPLQPSSAYAIGKVYAEHLCILYAKQYNLPVKIARCFAFVGPFLPLTTHFAIGNFIANVLAGEPIRILGDGSPCRSYLYAADLVAWLWAILCFGKPGRAYNVGSEESVSIAELAKIVSEQIIPPLEMTVAKQRDPHYPLERYVPSTKRAREELKLETWVSLSDAIQRTILWNQQHAKS